MGPLNQGRQALTDWGSGEQTIAPLSASAGSVLGVSGGRKKEKERERETEVRSVSANWQKAMRENR